MSIRTDPSWPSTTTGMEIEVYLRDGKVRFCIPLGGSLHVLSLGAAEQLWEDLRVALATGHYLETHRYRPPSQPPAPPVPPESP
jgi:hypothetical protein